VIAWLDELPAPHANGMRALVAMESTKILGRLRKWSNPPGALPQPGDQPPMPEQWVIAQIGLRYVGRMRDAQSWPVLERALTRRPEKVDVTMDSLMQGGLAIIGMTLRALGVGASQGFSEWGDRRAVEPLLRYVQRPKENEQSRGEACAALAWVMAPEDVPIVVRLIERYSEPDQAQRTIRGCLLDTLAARSFPGAATSLLPLLTPRTDPKTRHQVARVIGRAGVTPELEKTLVDLMQDDGTRNDAALALMLGGSPQVATRAVALCAGRDRAQFEELQDLWYTSFGFWSTEDLEQGGLFRWVANALAISRVEIDGQRQIWAVSQLDRQLDQLLLDNGPHSLTRPVLRTLLYRMAQKGDPSAVQTLALLRERGVLLALGDDAGALGRTARAALGRAARAALRPAK
jgi:hypothetical protein